MASEQQKAQRGGCGREEGVRTVKCERESASGRAGPEGCGGEVSMK